MSGTRHYKGTLKLVATTEESAERESKKYLNSIGKTELPKSCYTWLEYLKDYTYDDYVTIGDSLYSVELEDVGDEEVFASNKVEYGYKFEVQYYDGSMGFEEAIEEAIHNVI